MQLNPNNTIFSQNFINKTKPFEQNTTLNQVLFGYGKKPNTLNNVIKQYNPTNNLIFENLEKEQEKKTVNFKKSNNDNLVSNSESDFLSENQEKNSSYSTELVDTESDNDNYKEKTTNTHTDENTSLEVSDTESEDTKPELSETKLYWECGNTGLKIKNFSKRMEKNLAIMYYIDKIFSEYVNLNPLNTHTQLFEKSKNSENLEIKLPSGIIRINNLKVMVQINHEKIKGIFQVQETGFFNLSEILINKKDLKKNSIPSLKSILAHKENITHITKIIKMFNLSNKITINENVSKPENNFTSVIKNAEIYLTNTQKNKILKSNGKSGFYIKVYNNYTKGFICNKNNIYYFVSDINFKTGEIKFRYYMYEITKGIINKIEKI